MPINPTSLTTAESNRDANIALRFISVEPVPGESLSTPVRPNELVGYYDPLQDMVVLFLTDSTGLRYVKVA